MTQKKYNRYLRRTSIVMWIGIFMLYAAIFGPLLPKIVAWPLWAKIVLGVSMLVVPIALQITLIYRYDAKMQSANKKSR
ncbi:MAG TPA: hypothetical protein VFD05_02955 [Bacilli bacterium]|nr:hypothetical protein [Bacilli bacterium]